MRHLLAAGDPQKGKLYGHVQTMKNRTKVLEFCKYLRSLHPSEVRMAIVCDNVSPHLTTTKRQRVARRTDANNLEIAYIRTTRSWLNCIKSQVTALWYFVLDGTDHGSHRDSRRWFIATSPGATCTDERLRIIVDSANAA